MSKNKNNGSINGKGYYIALILCAMAIGITGYLYYRNADDAQQLQDPSAAVTKPGDDLEVVATDGNRTDPTSPSTQAPSI